MSVILCGHGRLGSLIEHALVLRGMSIDFARVDRTKGLSLNVRNLPACIDTLLICMVPRSNGDASVSPWFGLLNGVQQQIKERLLTIKRVVYVSSTAVFEGCAPGWCEASTPVVTASARSQGLIDAEQCVQQLAEHSRIVRLPGLIGPGYVHYDPIRMSSDQVRHSVDIRAAATVIAQWLCDEWTGHHIDIMTDGQIYFMQQKWSLNDCPLLIEMLSHSRIYRPTIIARVDE